jgi:hypothetical protein
VCCHYHFHSPLPPLAPPGTPSLRSKIATYNRYIYDYITNI